MTAARALGPLLLLAALVAACGGDKPEAKPTAAPAVSSGMAAERYFPLEDGKIYSYATREGTDTGMLVGKVRRSDATHGELRLSNATKRFVYTPDGVAYEGGATILKGPFDTGTRWPGEHGGTTTITSVDASVEVPAGRYAGCLRTVEEGGRPTGARYESTYCPGIGMVLLVVAAAGTEARAELKSYGMPLKIE